MCWRKPGPGQGESSKKTSASLVENSFIPHPVTDELLMNLKPVTPKGSACPLPLLGIAVGPVCSLFPRFPQLLNNDCPTSEPMLVAGAVRVAAAHALAAGWGQAWRIFPSNWISMSAAGACDFNPLFYHTAAGWIEI